jgi:ankyrin repeat protein
MATSPKGGKAIVSLLLEKGANVNVGVGKYTPLMNAASWVNIDVVELLLNNGADPSLVNEEGKKAADLIGDCNGCPEGIRLKSIL